MQLHKERGLSMQYRDGNFRTYFPTQAAWDSFIAFVRLLHLQEPFASRSTANDTYQAIQRAFANMLSDGLLPDTIEELFAYLPESFVRAVTVRTERIFSKVHGITFSGEYFFRVGHCWFGNYGQLSFDAIPETDTKSKKSALEGVADAFEDSTTVIAGNRNPGTSDRVKEDSDFQCELALSALSVLLNMTYQSAFARLWQLRRMDRPEFGLATQRSFSIIENDDSLSSCYLGFTVKFAEQWFDVAASMIDRWHESLGLGVLNKLVADGSYQHMDLVERLANAILHFRQAANQSTSAMQIAALWICVESFFTADSEQVLSTNLPGLLAMTMFSMHRDYWPKGAKTADDLKRVFARYYRYRSRTFHHGQRGHVGPRDVQEFSLVVSNLIIGVVNLIKGGMRTADELLQASKQFIDQLDHPAHSPNGRAHESSD